MGRRDARGCLIVDVARPTTWASALTGSSTSYGAAQAGGEPDPEPSSDALAHF